MQRKEQVVLSEEELTTLRLISSSISSDSNILEMLAGKRGVCLLKLVLVPKYRQPGVQLDLTSSELPKEIQQKVKEDSVKKIMFHAKTENVPANYVLQMYDDEDDSDSTVCTSYTRYETYYCSEE